MNSFLILIISVFLILGTIFGISYYKLKKIRSTLLGARAKIIADIEEHEKFHTTNMNRLDSFPPKIKADLLESLNELHNKIIKMHDCKDKYDQLISDVDKYLI